MFSRTIWAGVAAVALSTFPIAAQQSGTSAALSVTASVSKNCTISTTPVNFGAYDPVVANASSPQDSTGSVTVACTKGANARVGLDDGANSQGSTRRMQQSASAHLNYEIYKDAARTSRWGTTVDESLDLGAAPNRNPRTYPAYGRIPAGQDATVGSYTDTVVATVNF